jgi:hypothetical protein
MKVPFCTAALIFSLCAQQWPPPPNFELFPTSRRRCRHHPPCCRCPLTHHRLWAESIPRRPELGHRRHPKLCGQPATGLHSAGVLHSTPTSILHTVVGPRRCRHPTPLLRQTPLDVVTLDASPPLACGDWCSASSAPLPSTHSHCPGLSEEGERRREKSKKNEKKS